MIDPVVAYDKLASFETSDELACFLQGEGILGVRHSVSSCPLAAYMQVQTGVLSTVASNIKVYPTDDFVSTVQIFPHTNATSDFVEQLDMGEFPALVNKEE